MMVIIQIIVYGLGFYLLGLLFYYVFQDAFIFFPPKGAHGPVTDPSVERFSLDHEGVLLQGYLVHPEKAKDLLVVYFGGNGEDVSMTVEDYLEVDCASLFMAYRGYGESSGKPGQNEMFWDGEFIIDELKRRFSPKRLVLVGRSLGSSVACHVAAKKEVDGLILVTPFDSIVHIARKRYPWLPVGSLLKHPFDSTKSAPEVQCPTLVISGGQDVVIPASHTKTLIESFARQPEVVLIERAGHGDIELFPEYWQALLGFALEPGVSPETGTSGTI